MAEGGKYEGCLHLIIAVTPEAWYRLQTSEKLSQISGGFVRRIDAINLPPIPKHEGVNFVFQLLEYSYKSGLPNPLPMKSVGIFATIFQITKGNPGGIVKLFTKLLESAKIPEEKAVRVIDGAFLLEALEGEQVSVYGATSPCIEKNTLTRFCCSISESQRNKVAEKCEILFKTLLGELKPFSEKELKKRLRYHDYRITNLVNIVNNTLRQK
ncbi:MAG TPA: hypothetical protein ENF87_01460, partial [Thermoproteales archaeon]|nr:hypothetical protein [Thermoproteales archaeon]